MFDVVIVGGGPAGLNAALVLGRMRRLALVTDAGEPRNAVAAEMHGFLTRDGFPPGEVLKIGRAELAHYPTVEFRDVAVAEVSRDEQGFAVRLADGAEVRSRRVLIATGQRDDLAPIEGLAELWGRGVYHCPYCHGFEVRDKAIAVLGSDPGTVNLSVHLTRFSDDVVLCTNGPADLDAQTRGVLKLHGVEVREEGVTRVEGRDGAAERVVFESGEALPRTAVFFRPPLRQRSSIASSLGCEIFEDGAVKVNELQQTTLPGVYAAGDMARMEAWPFPGAQVIIAAAQGAAAAVVMDQEMLREDVIARVQAATSQAAG